MTPAEALRAFVSCVVAGGHDFAKGSSCARCTAEKDGKSLLDLIAEAKREKK